MFHPLFSESCRLLQGSKQRNVVSPPSRAPNNE